MKASAAAVDLYWIPLGAGGHSVRFNGKVFEALEATRHHRRRCDLYHAALVIELDGDRYTIEVTPSPGSFALRLGEAMLAAAPRGAEAVLDSITETLGGRILGRGTSSSSAS